MKKDLMVCLGLFMTGGSLIGGLIVHDKMEKQCKILLDSIELYTKYISENLKDIAESDAFTEDEKVLIVKKVGRKLTEVNKQIIDGTTKNMIISKKNHYKKALSIIREVYDNLYGFNYGWFYN